MLDATTRASHAQKISNFSQGGEGVEAGPAAGRDGLKMGAYLGIKGRTAASHERRGLQTIDTPPNIVEKIDPETGEIVSYSVTSDGKERLYKTHSQIRAERYALKSVVNRLFPTSETAKCHRAVIPGSKVAILKSPQHKKAHFGGLRQCGSVWLCPLCSAKIAERRRSELVTAIDTAKAMGLQVLLMTATVPHGLGDDVKLILEQMMKAWRKTTSDRQGKALRSLLGFVGTVRALEVTDGQNGFHPHFHVLIFAQPDFTANAFQEAFYPLWADACVKSGLPAPSALHGLRVDDGSWAAKYASKWGLEDEMTKGHLKASKGVKGRSPWDMLREALKSGCEASQRRFRVYAHAFKGRRQLYWSQGLKELLAIAEVTDEELAAFQDDTAVQLAELTMEQWRAVLASRSEASVLDLAERDQTRLAEFLGALELSLRVTEKGGVQ